MDSNAAKPHHGGLQREVQAGRGVGRQQRRDSVERPLGDQQAGDAPHAGEQDRLGEQLREELAASRAEGEANAHLGAAARPAGEQQVGDVGAGDQQHDRGDAEEEGERRLRLAVDGTLAAEARLHHDLLRLEADHGRLAHPLLKRRLDVGDDRMVHPVQRRLCLLQRYLRLESAEEIGPVALATLEAGVARGHHAPHGHRHEHHWPFAEGGAFEAARCHPDNGEGLAVDLDGLAEHRRVGAEVRGPVAVAQHGDEMPADGLIVAGPQQPSDSGLQLERREVGTGDQRATAADRLIVIGEVGAEAAVRGEAGEHRLALLEIPEHRVAEDHVAVAGLAAGLRARLGAGGRKIHQLIGFGHRQRLEQHLVDQREDRGVGPDAEGQREDRDRRHERRLEQGPEGERQVSHLMTRVGVGAIGTLVRAGTFPIIRGAAASGFNEGRGDLAARSRRRIRPPRCARRRSIAR